MVERLTGSDEQRGVYEVVSLHSRLTACVSAAFTYLTQQTSTYIADHVSKLGNDWQGLEERYVQCFPLLSRHQSMPNSWRALDAVYHFNHSSLNDLEVLIGAEDQRQVLLRVSGSA